MTQALEALKKEKPYDPFPKDLAPVFPTITKKIPADKERWLAQVEFEGVRAFLIVKKGQLSLNQITADETQDITGIFGEIEQPFVGFSHDLVLDGKIIFGWGKNKEDLQKVEERIGKKIKHSGDLNPMRASFVVNDYLYEEGFDLRQDSYEGRYNLLNSLIEPSIRNNYGIFPNYAEEDLASLIDAARHRGYSQVSFRRKNAKYTPRVRNSSWKVYTIPST